MITTWDETGTDTGMVTNLEGFDEVSQRLIRQLPVAQFDYTESMVLERYYQPIESFGNLLKSRTVTCRQLLNLARRWFEDWLIDSSRKILQKLWRLQDLRDGGGLGFAVEVFSFPSSNCYLHFRHTSPTPSYTPPL
ncbi:hypothetical protein BGY98DRAFT_981657 [Russula aff. rugulosa BPL654]|nr:hypothetical protein BGY98DRAFT_981657 [Russula aff. rugulosa BPL654]